MANNNKKKGKGDKGKGKGNKGNDLWGDGVSWLSSNFMPAWNPNDLFTTGRSVPFSSDLRGQSQKYLPLYVNNDGSTRSTTAFVLALDDLNSSVGFSQETYVLKEEWDTSAGSLSDYGFQQQLLIKNGQLFTSEGDGSLSLLANLNQIAFLVDGSSRPNAAPKLVNGGPFKETVIFIEDASDPDPRQLTSASEQYTGGAAVDVVYAGAGNDTIAGGGNNDKLRGEAGNDILSGNDGDDVMLGEAGNDTLYGGNSSSVIDSNAKVDYLNGGSGNDYLYGEAGSDILDGMAGDDFLDGGTDIDALFGSSGNDTLQAGSGGEFQTQYLDGGSGHDRLVGGANSNLNGYGETATDETQYDTLVGGEGVDTFVLGGSWGVSYFESGDGYAIIQNWDATQDSIQVAGSLNSYFVKTTNVIGAPDQTDTEIYYTDASGQSDRIAIVQDKVITVDNLSPSFTEPPPPPNSITGDSGNNRLVGTLDDDRLNGYGVTVNDRSQFDTLIGGAGGDYFVLGGTWGTSYIESGDGYAIIQDWEPHQDLIEVAGNLSQYRLEFKTVNGIGSAAQDTEIYFTNANGQSDRIAIVQDTKDVIIAKDFVLA
ncbi:MAG: hypothetical protein Kow00121_21700 [Elainellaceae cyanobacterium]